MDSKNRFHTAATYWVIRGEHLAILAACTALLLWHAGAVNWWRAFVAFWIIDLVGYLPGAIAYRCSKDRQVHRWYYHAYNIAHTYLVAGLGVAAWAYCIGGLEWAMLAVPFHLSVDRGVFGNILKPAELAFEPTDHPDDVVLRALGRGGDAGTALDVGAERLRAKEVLAGAPGHPSGFLALSSRNKAFVVEGIPGLVCYRRQGKHLWLFGGVHSQPEHAGALLDHFLRFAAEQRLRVGAIQVRQSQVELFASRGFTVNQLGTTYGVSLPGYSFAGGPKMQLRNKIKRARALGLRVVELGKDVPRDETWFRKVEEVSARWLQAKGKKELDFMVGEVGDCDDHDRRIFLVVDANEQAVAFISYVPVWGQERPGYLHDLTRRDADAPPGTMELCNAFAIERFQAEGVQCLHFGFTPFIIDDEEGRPASRLISRLIRLLRQYGRWLYPADSQAAYKMKWGTDFTEREYIAARPISVSSGRWVQGLLAGAPREALPWFRGQAPVAPPEPLRWLAVRAAGWALEVLDRR